MDEWIRIRYQTGSAGVFAGTEEACVLSPPQHISVMSFLLRWGDWTGLEHRSCLHRDRQVQCLHHFHCYPFDNNSKAPSRVQSVFDRSQQQQLQLWIKPSPAPCCHLGNGRTQTFCFFLFSCRNFRTAHQCSPLLAAHFVRMNFPQKHMVFSVCIYLHVTWTQIHNFMCRFHDTLGV